MLPANFRKETSIRNILSQSLSSSKFEVFFFPVHDFGDMLMFHGGSVLFMFLFFLTNLLGYLKWGNSMVQEVNAYQIKRDKKRGHLETSNALQTFRALLGWHYLF